MKTRTLTLALAALIAFPAAAKSKRQTFETPWGLRISLNLPEEVRRGEVPFFEEVNRAVDAGAEIHSAFFDVHDNFIASINGAEPLKSEWDWSRVTVTTKHGDNLIQLVSIEGSISILGHWRCISKTGSAYRLCASFDRPGVTTIEKAAGAYEWELIGFGESPGPIMKQFEKLGR